MSEIPRYVLGIDPGMKTGLALFDLIAETCEGHEVIWNEYGFHLEVMIEKYKPAVVAEAFVINSATVKNMTATWSLRGIGIAEYLAAKYGCYFEVQPQSSAKRFATNERLDALGWRIPGRGHLADAQRQALLYAVKHGWWHPLLSEDDRGTIDTTD